MPPEPKAERELAVAAAFSAAMLESRFEAIDELLAEDVVLHSPITSGFRFEGRADVVRVLRQVDASGAIREFTVLIRPLAGLTRLQAELGPAVARGRGHWRALLVRAFTAPLAAITSRSDRLGARIVGRRYEPGDG